MTPLNLRRWRRFKRNRRGWYSLWLLSALLLISANADWLASSQPLLVRYAGQWYFPTFSQYPDSTFGGDLPLPANFHEAPLRERIQTSGGWMLWAPIPFDYQSVNLALPQPAPAPPSAQNWLGTDDQGRDVLARIIYGFRLSLLFAVSLTLGSTLIGVAVGAVQGYHGGWIDLLGQRFLEIWSGLPVLYLPIILASIVQPSFLWLLAIMLLFFWMHLVDVVRIEFLRGRNLEYVRAAQALGMGHAGVMFWHILPNAMVATLTYLPFLLSGAIGTLTALDFLGFGLPVGSPSLGELVAQGKANLQAPWLGIAAFSTLALLLTLLIFIGEAARDALDPRA
ncbi:MAG: Inner membrane ABC transporter permease protein YejE [Pseudomonas citronellolis]|nr:MAG: Inner membrane ABC transporter permease protein YejE [Pseudomonas citronellolis]